MKATKVNKPRQGYKYYCPLSTLYLAPYYGE